MADPKVPSTRRSIYDPLYAAGGDGFLDPSTDAYLDDIIARSTRPRVPVVAPPSFYQERVAPVIRALGGAVSAPARGYGMILTAAGSRWIPTGTRSPT